MADTRPWKAGEDLGKAIIEMVNLMYQNKTALAFIKALSIEINTERQIRERRKEIEDAKQRRKNLID